MFQDQLAEKVRPFIDLIDDMRSIGIDKELPLPTIAVVGDQSSGKSSVLETLSGVSLPRGTGENLYCFLNIQKNIKINISILNIIPNHPNSLKVIVELRHNLGIDSFLW